MEAELKGLEEKAEGIRSQLSVSTRTMKMADFQNLGTEQQRAFMAEVKAGKAKLID